MSLLKGNVAFRSDLSDESYCCIGGDAVRTVDPEIADAIDSELERQNSTLELIASENIASAAVMAAQGSVLTNKYAEGYPDARYYGGCEFVDVAERLCVDRARRLFSAEYANVQPHSGSQANMAVYFSLLEPGDTVLGMKLAHGGHLTHGSPVNFSGRLFRFEHYGVDPETGRIDYGDVERIARRCEPKMIVAGASAYPRIIDFKRLGEIARSVGAYLMVDMAHIAGLVAAGVHPSPVPHADVVTTTTHKTLRGPRGGMILSRTDFGKKLDKQVFPGIQGGPLMHVIAAKAVALKEALGESFRAYQTQTVANAAALARSLQEEDVSLVSGGTDNHLILVDLTDLGITGRDAEQTLDRAGITVNKNAIPTETRSPRLTSGIRLGTPSLTSRGMKETEMYTVGKHVANVLRYGHREKVIRKVRQSVRDLCAAFPVCRDESTDEGEDRMKTNMVVTVTSQDRPGVVEKATKVIHEHGGNLQESRGSRLGGIFANIMVVSVEEDRYDLLAEAFHALDGNEFHFHIQPAPPVCDYSDRRDQPYRLDVSGADHEGILHGIASYLADQGANIDELATSVEHAPLSGDPLFSMHVHVVFPSGVDRREMMRDLERISREKCIDVELRPRVGRGPLRFDEDTNVIPVPWKSRGMDVCAARNRAKADRRG